MFVKRLKLKNSQIEERWSWEVMGAANSELLYYPWASFLPNTEASLPTSTHQFSVFKSLFIELYHIQCFWWPDPILELSRDRSVNHCIHRASRRKGLVTNNKRHSRLWRKCRSVPGQNGNKDRYTFIMSYLHLIKNTDVNKTVPPLFSAEDFVL